jgi:hypothetical protein
MALRPSRGEIVALMLGRKPAVRPIGLSDLRYYTATDSFPTPPATFAAPTGVSWGMDGNDTLGDCTIAGVDHLIAAWDALFNVSDARPSLATLEAEYHTLSPDDTGCVEATVLADWMKPGLFGQTIAAYAPLDYRNVVELQQGVAFLGGAYLGIACPGSAQQQFAQQQQSGKLVPWTVVHGSKIEGGHCIVAVGYTAAGLLCVSWGSIVEVTWAFLRKYLEEAWGIVSHELAEKGADTLGLNLAALQADLSAIASSTPSPA